MNRPSHAKNREAHPSHVNIFHGRRGRHKVRHAPPHSSHAKNKHAILKDGFITLQIGCRKNLRHTARGSPKNYGANNGSCGSPFFLPSESYKRLLVNLKHVIKVKLHLEGSDQRSLTFKYCGFRRELSILGVPNLKVRFLRVQCSIRTPQHTSATVCLSIRVPCKYHILEDPACRFQHQHDWMMS